MGEPIMSEAVARAVGAEGATTVTIANIPCTVRPLGIKELTEVERHCLDIKRREATKTIADNVDLLPKDQREFAIRDKLEEVSKWDVSDLPAKWANDPAKIKICKKLSEWLKSHLDLEAVPSAAKTRTLASALLDSEGLSESEYKTLTGRAPARRVKIEFVNWWITGCYDGMITFIWVCFKHNGVTKEQVADELGKNQEIMITLSREIERLSAPQVKNG